MLNHVNDTSQSAWAGNSSVTAAAYEMSLWGGTSDQKVWAARKRPEASQKQEGDVWRHRAPSLPANERLPGHSQAGLCYLRARQRQSQAGGSLHPLSCFLSAHNGNTRVGALCQQPRDRSLEEKGISKGKLQRDQGTWPRGRAPRFI